jgi:hypothetical protein
MPVSHIITVNRYRADQLIAPVAEGAVIN